jgi:hypothetical protein
MVRDNRLNRRNTPWRFVISSYFFYNGVFWHLNMKTVTEILASVFIPSGLFVLLYYLVFF